MIRPLKQATSIAMLTALEASRQPVFLLLTTSTVLFIAMMPLLITHIIGDSARMVRDSALAVQFTAGLVLGAYAATATITRELHKGTLASIISKPVSRALFFLSKFAGIAAIMTIFSVMATLATMLSVRTAAETFLFDWWGIGPLLASTLLAYAWAGIQNFRTRTPFVSRAFWLLALAVIAAFALSCLVDQRAQIFADDGHGHSHGAPADATASPIPWNILPAGLLIGMGILLLSAWSASLAIRLDTVPTLSICFTVFMTGLMSDYLFGRRAGDHVLFTLLYGLVPNWQNFWAVDALTRGGIPDSYVWATGGYTAIYAAVVLLCGLVAFYRMEVK